MLMALLHHQGTGLGLLCIKHSLVVGMFYEGRQLMDKNVFQ